MLVEDKFLWIEGYHFIFFVEVNNAAAIKAAKKGKVAAAKNLAEDLNSFFKHADNFNKIALSKEEILLWSMIRKCKLRKTELSLGALDSLETARNNKIRDLSVREARRLKGGQVRCSLTGGSFIQDYLNQDLFYLVDPEGELMMMEDEMPYFDEVECSNSKINNSDQEEKEIEAGGIRFDDPEFYALFGVELPIEKRIAS